MPIGTRTLKLRDGDVERDVLISIHPPIYVDGRWSCAYEIDWPTRPRRFAAAGADALQAARIAFEMVGTDIYTSDYHASGKLRWGEPGTGYGFPVPSSIRDLLIGDDKKFFG